MITVFNQCLLPLMTYGTETCVAANDGPHNRAIAMFALADVDNFEAIVRKGLHYDHRLRGCGNSVLSDDYENEVPFRMKLLIWYVRFTDPCRLMLSEISHFFMRYLKVNQRAMLNQA